VVLGKIGGELVDEVLPAARLPRPELGDLADGAAQPVGVAATVVLLAQVTWRALRRSNPSRRRFCPAVSVEGIRRGSRSSETNAEQATPKSTPQPGRRFGGAGSAAVATPNETYQPRASLEVVALRTMPPSGQDSRNRTQTKLR
jgi:predicted lipid-binding transport protein (Tim44 family)